MVVRVNCRGGGRRERRAPITQRRDVWSWVVKTTGLFDEEADKTSQAKKSTGDRRLIHEFTGGFTSGGDDAAEGGVRVHRRQKDPTRTTVSGGAMNVFLGFV